MIYYKYYGDSAKSHFLYTFNNRGLHLKDFFNIPETPFMRKLASMSYEKIRTNTVHPLPFELHDLTLDLANQFTLDSDWESLGKQLLRPLDTPNLDSGVSFRYLSPEIQKE